MNDKEIIYSDELVEFDEYGNIVITDLERRQSARINKLLDDIESGKVVIDMNETVTSPRTGKVFPRWMVDEFFTYVMDEETFTYIPLIPTN